MSKGSPSFVQRMLARWSHFILAHAGAVVLASVLLTAASVWAIVARFDIRSDLKDLLPEDTPSVVETFQIAERMGSITPLTILIEAPDRSLQPEMRQSAVYEGCRAEAIERAEARHAQLVAIAEADGTDPPAPLVIEDSVTEHCDDGLVLFARALVEELSELDLIGYVHYRNDKSFFEDHVLLYASVDDLERLYTDIDKALTETRDQVGQYKSCLLIEGSEAACAHLEPSLKKRKNQQQEASAAAVEAPTTGGTDDDIDFSEAGLRRRYGGNLDDSEINHTGEYNLSQLPDGSWVIKVDVRFRDATTSLKANQDALATIDEVVAELGPDNFHPDMRVVYGGGFRSQKEQYEAIVNDIKLSAGSTIGGILLLIFLFFRRVRATFIVMLPLVMSIGWTLALTFLTVGYLNLITAFIFAILLGLGIDFGIHILARYEEARARGRTDDEAMTVSVSEIGAANVAGALTTSATFATLMLADFRGFSQFGLIAALGVLVALFAMLTVLPAMVIAVERLVRSKPRKLVGGTAMPHSATRRGLMPYAWAMVIVVFAVAGYAVSHVGDIQFEENFYRLQMRKADWKSDDDRYKVTEDRHSSPAIVLTDSLEEVHALEQVLARRKDPHAVKDMREFARLYPNFFDRFVGSLASPISYLSDLHATAPAMALARRIIPTALARTIPDHTRFDHDGTRALKSMKRFAAAYPNLGARLASQLETPLRHVPRYALLDGVTAMQEAPALASLVIPDRRKSDRLTSVRDIVSIFSFVPGTPAEQLEKLAVIERIRERTARRNIRFLPRDEQAEIQKLRRYLVSDTVEVDDLPTWVKIQFKEGGTNPRPPRADSGVDFAFGTAALVYQSTSSQNGPQARRFTNEMRTVEIDTADGPFRPIMATNAFVFADLLDQIEKDGVQLAFLAFGIVLLVVFVQHRSILQTLIVIAPLAVALSWTVGLMELLHIKLGFFNIVILPVIIGIGIDDGIHHYHRYREEGRGSVLHSLRYTGGAMWATSTTTCVGFGGMLMSQHQGLNTMGELALIGIGCAWLATVTVQPALILLAERFNLRSVIPDHEFDPDRLPSADASPTIDADRPDEPLALVDSAATPAATQDEPGDEANASEEAAEQDESGNEAAANNDKAGEPVA